MATKKKTVPKFAPEPTAIDELAEYFWLIKQECKQHKLCTQCKVSSRKLKSCPFFGVPRDWNTKTISIALHKLFGE